MTHRHPLRIGFWTGLVAGLAFLFFMVAFRLALGTPSVLEVLAERFITLLPPPLFSFLLDRLLQLGKPLLSLGLALGLVLLGGAGGIAYAWAAQRMPKESLSAPLLRGLGMAALLWLMTVLGIVPLAGGGLFGASLAKGPWFFSLAAGLTWAIYGVSLAFLYHQSLPPPSELAEEVGDTANRRAFLRRMGLWALVVGLVGFGVRSIATGVTQMAPSKVPTREPGVLSPEVTPNDRFYVVSKNLVDPIVDEREWQLKVAGQVERPYTLTYKELEGLPAVEEYVTLECISNPVGGTLISNALWKGVPLARLLEQAGLKPGVRKIAFKAWDGYSDSIPLEQAKREEVLVAYLMNGEPLPPKHGFPARLIIPGRFGLKSVKWVKSIEAVDYDLLGFWQERGWSDSAEVLTTSQLWVPAAEARVPAAPVAPVGLGGAAFAGARGISRVEVSDDGGKTWSEALLQRPLSSYTWVLWTRQWLPRGPGRLTLRVRAVDGTGHVQEAREQDPLPDGATGYHAIVLTVG